MSKFHRFKGASAHDRLFLRVEKTPTCWLWTGPIDGWGYGHCSIDSKMWQAHRLSWVIHGGDIPKGMVVMHTCDIRNCVNPEHLKLGTHKENMEDRVKKGRYGRNFAHQFPRSKDVRKRQRSRKSASSMAHKQQVPND